MPNAISGSMAPIFNRLSAHSMPYIQLRLKRFWPAIKGMSSQGKAVQPVGDLFQRRQVIPSTPRFTPLHARQQWIPVGKCLIRDELSGQVQPDSLQKPVLAIVDEFKVRNYPLLLKETYGELRGDAYATHGDIVKAHALNTVPDLNIQKFQVSSLGSQLYYDINPALEDLHEQVKARRRFDAVNVSFSVPLSFKTLREELKAPKLAPHTVHRYRDDIIDRLDRLAFVDLTPEEWKILDRNGYDLGAEARASIQFLDEIGEKAPVFVAAGNEGPHSLNALLLAKNAVGVGATIPIHMTAPYSGRNSLIKQWAEVHKKAVPVLADYGDELKGFGLKPLKDRQPYYWTFEKPVIIPLSRLKTHRMNREKVWEAQGWTSRVLTGTSYATPQVAAREALKRSLAVPPAQTGQT